MKCGQEKQKTTQCGWSALIERNRQAFASAGGAALAGALALAPAFLRFR
jgi:hypothetical protein